MSHHTDIRDDWLDQLEGEDASEDDESTTESDEQRDRVILP
jgi:hypothetical protein